MRGWARDQAAEGGVQWVSRGGRRKETVLVLTGLPVFREALKVSLGGLSVSQEGSVPG